MYVQCVEHSSIKLCLIGTLNVHTVHVCVHYNNIMYVPTCVHNTLSYMYEVTSPCNHGDVSKSTPRLPVLKFCRKHNIATYIEHGSLYTCCLLKIRGPAQQVIELDGCQNAQTRAAAGISIEKNEKTSIIKAYWYTKLKKQVAGDFLVSSCHASLVPRLSRGRRKRAWCTLFAHALNLPAFQ